MLPRAHHEGNVESEQHGSTDLQEYPRAWLRLMMRVIELPSILLLACLFLACLFLRVCFSFLIAICKLFVGVCDYSASACLFFVSVSYLCLVSVSEVSCLFLCCRIDCCFSRLVFVSMYRFPCLTPVSMGCMFSRMPS